MIERLAGAPGRAELRRILGSALAVVAFLGASAPHASAKLIVDLAGTGTGTVASNPVGVECGNVGGGAPGPACSASFAETPVQLTAVPAADSYFVGWTGDDPFGGFFGQPDCNSGSANPCTTIDLEGFGFPPGSDVHISATFDVLPDPPSGTTGSVDLGKEVWLRTLEGTVNPNGFKVDECYFEYGMTTNYGSTTPCVDPDASELDESSTSAEPVKAETEPLEPEATYHYRLVASNIAGAHKGEDRTLTTAPAPEGNCPNEGRRHEQGIAAILLPACMALEMASPSQKAGASANAPDVSADGSRVAFLAATALGEDAPGFPYHAGTPYVASRTEAGWASESTVPDAGFGRLWDFTSGKHPSFMPDFSRWFGIGATWEQAQRGTGRAYEAGLGGLFRPLADLPMPLTTEIGFDLVSVVNRSVFQGASADHSHLYFRVGANATYQDDDPSLLGPGAEEDANVYLARRSFDDESVLELLNRDHAGKIWGGNCGVRIGGIGSVRTSGLPAPNGERNQGAVSTDGSRTLFSARAAQPQSGDCKASSKLRILERRETPSGPVIAPLFTSECSRPPAELCSSADGDDLYQGASLDQTKVYFTTNRQLTNSDRDGSSEECSVLIVAAGCDLYLYDHTRDAGERLVQVSAGQDVPGKHEAGKEANLYNGITAISADGSHVYFVATGVLTDDTNPEGASAQPAQPNLYTWEAESEETVFLGTLESGDAITGDKGDGLWGGQGTWRNNAYPVPVLSAAEQSGERGEEGGDGHILVFESHASLTPNDADNDHLDVYRYDGSGETLKCLSCAPGSSESEPDEAPFDVEGRGEPGPLGTDFAESRRWVSEDGDTVGFLTPQPLLPGDVNGANDGYLWRDGELVRLPGRSPTVITPLTGLPGPFLSHDGSTIAFVTSTVLLAGDGDTVGDIYVARIGGGYPTPPEPPVCEPGNPSRECREPQPTPPPAPQTDSEATGPGNPPSRRPCGKGKIRRKGRCVAKHKHNARKHRPRAKNRQRARQANADWRAAQ